MIDYRTHIVALEHFRTSLGTKPFSEPQIAAKRDEQLTQVSQAEDFAYLGSMLDHLIAHSASDGTEISLLERASTLWRQGVSLYDALGSIRHDMEAALEFPADPASPGKYNTATMNAQQLARDLTVLNADIDQLRKDIDPLPHLKPHPRQLDAPIGNWNWGDLFIARRTNAFAREVLRHANSSNTAEVVAFALGAISSYGGNAAGSNYVGQVVGGPRRSHRYRDRLARNTIGSWCKANYPTLPSLKWVANRIRYGSVTTPVLPTKIVNLLNNSFSSTFDLSVTSPVPDFQLGYQRLVRHLELIEDFEMPAVPFIPQGKFGVVLFNNPSASPPSLRPQSEGTSDPGGSGSGSSGSGAGSSTPGSGQPDQSDSKDNSGNICAAVIALIILIVILLVVALVDCIVKWADHKKCNYFENLGDMIKKLFEKDPPDPRDPPPTQDPQISSQALAVVASRPESEKVVGYLFDLHQQVWEALSRARGYLAVCGLVYPDDQLTQPLYAQFISTPPNQQWPYREMANAQLVYHKFPSSALEKPVLSSLPFPPSLPPSVILNGMPGLSVTTCSEIAINVWEQFTRGVLDANNLDMDADRGPLAACWNTVGSIHSDPVNVHTLAYATT